MLWGSSRLLEEVPFDTEAELEQAIVSASATLFGSKRVYLDVKKKIGAKGGVANIPDGYLIDLSSIREPKLYVVEVELAKHEPLKHIAVQILEFSLSFETNPTGVKRIIKDALLKDAKAAAACSKYATANGYDNLDYLLERVVFGPGTFNALVVIDELPEELETVLASRFKFPVEIVTVTDHCLSNATLILYGA